MNARARQPEPLAELASSALRELVRGLWQWRLEILVLALLTGAWWLLQHALPPIAAAAAIVAVTAGLVAFASLRLPAALRPFHAARVRRSLMGALSRVQGAHSASGAILRVRRVRRIPAGDLVSVRVARGHTVAELEHQAELVSANLHLHDCRVQRDRSDASRATVLLMRRDPWEGAAPITWPPVCDSESPSRHPSKGEQPEALRTPNSESLLRRKSPFRAKLATPEPKGENHLDFSLWDPIPLGLDEVGEPVTISLPERNIVVGGEPGAGKSTTVSLLAAAAALSDARLYIIDGGEADGALWAPVADALVGADRRAAIALLEKLHAAVDKRRTELVRRGIRKVTREDADWARLGLLIVDELPYFLNGGKKEERELFADLLRDLIARSRKVGLITVLAAQRPAADTVPASIRDLCGYRFALRCATRDASDVVLGRGWATAGYDASTIPGGQRGVGFLLTDEAQPIRLRTYLLGDDQVAELVERATAARIDREERPGERTIAT